MAAAGKVLSRQLTLTGGVQRLSDALTVKTPGGADDIPCRQIIISPDDGNGGAVFIGDAALLESSDTWGARLAATSPPLSLGPYDTGPLKLSDLYVDGTANDKVHVLMVAW